MNGVRTGLGSLTWHCEFPGGVTPRRKTGASHGLNGPIVDRSALPLNRDRCDPRRVAEIHRRA
ncbi:hypothetical protein AOX55_00006836 (plasmid) [Sinorhizobium fredii CCBAU 25509]|nr:hypothetical protein SF83666_b68850 [Sinorhizobium fredii CCBAU 83666]AWM29611.1 hypothetical protein AOX55_00006836 [Sinorhizobium fredii CCBAU 25509]GEC32646.1 hypothetical protein EFR01_28170 [Sinorhizobium fredii]GLS07288.1 hypothetical protein GCM10007864_09150 [Sinorhizobium fredii]